MDCLQAGLRKDKIGGYVQECVDASELDDFLFIAGTREDGAECDVCHVGNGADGPKNAALIVTAPEMAAELRAVNELLSAYVNHEPVEMCAFAERLDAVREILAKSVG